MSNGLRIRAGACPVCGSRDVRSDAVEQSGWLLLAECPRCDHRWTQRLPAAPAAARAPERASGQLREVANAA